MNTFLRMVRSFSTSSMTFQRSRHRHGGDSVTGVPRCLRASERVSQRAVEPPNEGEQLPELLREERRQSRIGDLRVRESAAARVRLVPQPLCRGMILGESARHSLEHGSVIETAEALREAAGHPAESRVILGDRVAKLVELRPRRHPQTASDKGFSAGLEMEVETRAPVLRLAADSAT